MIRFFAAVALAAAMFPEVALAYEVVPRSSPVMRCENRNTVLEFLAKKYHEKVVARGVTTTGSMIEIMISPRGETWTLLLSSGKGISCLIAAGANWRRTDGPPPLGPPVAHEKDRPD